MKISIPFFGNDESALGKIESALQHTEPLAAERQQRMNELEAVNESLNALEATRRRRYDRLDQIQERIEQETDRYGNPPKVWVDALADVTREYEDAKRQHESAKSEADRLHQLLHEDDAPQAPTEIKAGDVVAAQDALKATLDALAKVDVAIAAEQARRLALTLDDGDVVTARNALEDLYADAIDDAVQSADIAAAQKRLADAESRFTTRQARYQADLQTATQTLAGLERKRQGLMTEHHRRDQLLDHAKRLFWDTEIRQATQAYGLALAKTKAQYSRVVGLGQLAQKRVAVEIWEPLRTDVESATRAERARIAF